MAEIRSYINNVKATVEVNVDTLNKICDEFDLNYISINEYDPSYMRGEELNITDNDYNTKTYLLPKKKAVTIDWIIEKINAMQNTEKAYKNLSKQFQKIAQKYEKLSIYPTTYGIGVHQVYTDNDSDFKEILDINEIEYKLEYSDALWVKRIKFSKTKENLEKIEKLKIN